MEDMAINWEVRGRRPWFEEYIWKLKESFSKQQGLA
jgi:hypothetical protein